MEHVSIVVMILILRVIPIQCIHNLYIPRVKDTKKSLFNCSNPTHPEPLNSGLMIYIYFSKGISHIYVEEYPKSVSIGNIRGGIYMFLMRFRHLSKNNCFFWRKFLGNPLLLIYVISEYSLLSNIPLILICKNSRYHDI